MRSRFAAVAVAGVVMGAALLGGARDAIAEAPQVPAPSRATASSKFALVIDGATVGWVQSVEGGHATSDVVTDKRVPDNVVHKHLAGVKYEDIKVTFGREMSKPLYDWIKAAFDHRHVRKDGSIHSCDYDANIKSTLDFFHGLISEIGFPALDASSKDTTPLTVKVSPELTRVPQASGKVGALATALATGDKPGPKTWSPAGFRLDFPGCGEPCKAASKISAVRLDVAAPALPGQPPAAHHCSPILVTMPPSKDLAKWVVDGAPRDGTLEYRTADGTVAFALKLVKTRALRVTPIQQQQAGAKPLVELELQPESVEPSSP